MLLAGTGLPWGGDGVLGRDRGAVASLCERAKGRRAARARSVRAVNLSSVHPAGSDRAPSRPAGGLWRLRVKRFQLCHMLEHSRNRASGEACGEGCEDGSFEVQAVETGLQRGHPQVRLCQSREAAAAAAGFSLSGAPRPAVRARGGGGRGQPPAVLRPRPPRRRWSTSTPPRCPLVVPRARDCRLGDGGEIPICDEGRRPKDVTRTRRRHVIPKRRN